VPLLQVSCRAEASEGRTGAEEAGTWQYSVVVLWYRISLRLAMQSLLVTYLEQSQEGRRSMAAWLPTSSLHPATVRYCSASTPQVLSRSSCAPSVAPESSGSGTSVEGTCEVTLLILYEVSTGLAHAVRKYYFVYTKYPNVPSSSTPHCSEPSLRLRIKV
jgi:hypothetical protein